MAPVPAMRALALASRPAWPCFFGLRGSYYWMRDFKPTRPMTAGIELKQQIGWGALINQTGQISAIG